MVKTEENMKPMPLSQNFLFLWGSPWRKCDKTWMYRLLLHTMLSVTKHTL